MFIKNILVVTSILIGIISIIGGCTSPIEDEYIHGLWSSVDSVEVISNTNGEIKLSCIVSIGTPCEEFDRVESKVNGRDVSVRFYSKEKKSTICVQVLSSMRVPFSIKLTQGKKYTFHFWRLGEASLDLALRVN